MLQFFVCLFVCFFPYCGNVKTLETLLYAILSVQKEWRALYSHLDIFFQDYEEDEDDDDDEEDDTGMGDEGEDSNEGTGSADGNDGYEADDAEVTGQN